MGEGTVEFDSGSAAKPASGNRRNPALSHRSSPRQQLAGSGFDRTVFKTKKTIVLPVFEGRRGHPVIFSASLYDELQVASLETGARAVVWAHTGEVEEVQTNEEGCVLNLNDPEAMNKAMQRKD